MNMEGNLYKKHEKEIADADNLSEAIEQSESLKPEWATRLTTKEEDRKQKAEAELEKLQKASNDENVEEISRSNQ